MHTFENEFREFRYREINTPLAQLFPRLNTQKIGQILGHLKSENPHQTIFNVARELWNGGYDQILKDNGFWDTKYSTFSGHCHQCTPVLGLALRVLGFADVSYLECYRIREHFLQTGMIEQVPPQEEPNPEMKEEFCGIGRIPYCCLEVRVGNELFYLTGKHLRPDGEKTESLLSTVCYRSMTGVFAHPDDPTKSGIYLHKIIPTVNPSGIDFTRRIVWMKQTKRDPAPEYFATFLRMKLV